MKLFLIHCGFYDEELSNGIYEFHIGLPVVAEDEEVAKQKVRKNPTFLKKKMHIDGIQEIREVEGWEIQFKQTYSASTKINAILHRDL